MAYARRMQRQQMKPARRQAYAGASKAKLGQNRGGAAGLLRRDGGCSGERSGSPSKKKWPEETSRAVNAIHAWRAYWKKSSESAAKAAPADCFVVCRTREASRTGEENRPGRA